MFLSTPLSLNSENKYKPVLLIKQMFTKDLAIQQKYEY